MKKPSTTKQILLAGTIKNVWRKTRVGYRGIKVKIKILAPKVMPLSAYERFDSISNQFFHAFIV